MKELQLPDGRKLLLPVLPMEAYGLHYAAGKKYGTPFSQLYYSLGGFRHRIDFDDFDDYCTIVGTIHYENGKPVFGFDPTPFVESRQVSHGVTMIPTTRYRLYNESLASLKAWYNISPEKSFLSRLNAEADVWFMNPLGEEPDIDQRKYVLSEGTDGKEYRLSLYEDDLAAWRAAEEKVVRGKLIVIQQG